MKKTTVKGQVWTNADVLNAPCRVCNRRILPTELDDIRISKYGKCVAHGKCVRESTKIVAGLPVEELFVPE